MLLVGHAHWRPLSRCSTSNMYTGSAVHGRHCQAQAAWVPKDRGLAARLVAQRLLLCILSDDTLNAPTADIMLAQRLLCAASFSQKQ
jgi:hypothetical protein